jgi:hypothetical protein
MEKLVHAPAPGPQYDARAAFLAALFAAEASLQAPELVTAVHGARVNLKRARAIARLGAMKTARRGARAVLKVLEPARDLAALAGVAAKAERRTRGKAAKGLACVAAALRAEMAAANAKLDLAEIQSKLRALIADSARLQKTPIDPTLAATDQVKLTERAWRGARRANNLEARHTWRQREKDRAWAQATLGNLWPAGVRARSHCRARLTAALGVERDVRLLARMLKEKPHLAGTKSGARAARRALKKMARRYRDRADRLGARLHSASA